MKKKARGSAKIHLTLANGELIVHHGYEGRELHRRPMYEGEWNKLWDFIENNKKRG